MSELDYGAECVLFDLFSISGIFYETDCPLQKAQKSHSSYSFIYITDGKGVLHTGAIKRELLSGYVAVAAPSSDWSIENISGLKYIRIIYYGTEAQKLANQFGIKRTVKLYCGLTDIADLWKSCIQLPGSIAVLRCKGLIYYTFSEIERLSADDTAVLDVPNAAYRIKAFIDTHFTNSELNLNYISEKLSYHPNYISSVFTAEFHLSIVKYINVQRILHACYLMEQGAVSIKEIAHLCGYENVDYFSSVFKSKMGVTPKNHMKYLQMKTHTDY